MSDRLVYGAVLVDKRTPIRWMVIAAPQGNLDLPVVRLHAPYSVTTFPIESITGRYAIFAIEEDPE